MVQPIQYQIPGALNPFENLVSGLKLGTTMADMDTARAQQQAATQLVQQKALAEQAKIAQEKALQDATAKFQAKPTKTFDDYQQLSLLMTDPQASKNLIDSFESKSKDDQNKEKRKASQYAHAIAVNPQIAIEMMNKEADDLEAAGDKIKARTWRDTAKMTEVNPKNVSDVLLTTYGQVFGKEWTEATIAATQAPFAKRTAEAAARTGEAAANVAGITQQAKIDEARANASLAVQNAANAVATAPDDVAKAKAMRKFEEAKADLEKVNVDVAKGTQQARIDEAIAKAKAAEIEIKTLSAKRDAELSKATSDAQTAAINAKYADQIAKASLKATNAQAFASGAAAQASKASAGLTEQQTLKLKKEIARGPLPEYSEKLGGFVVAPTKENPNGGFLPLNAAADVKQQKSAVNALKSAGYDPETGEDRISRLISQSTSGSVQAYTTALLNSIAISTSGSRAIKELESTANSISLDLLDGKIGAGISNADRDFIVGTLGDVANPKTPAGDRLAAWNAARNRMIVSGMVPPPKKVKPEGSFGEPTTPNPAKAAAVRSQADAILRGEK